MTLEVECLDRLYLNGYLGRLATSGGLVTFMQQQLRKPIPSPVVLGQVTEKLRDAVKAQAEHRQIPVYQFNHKERKDDIANDFRRQRGVRDQIVFIGVEPADRAGVRSHFFWAPSHPKAGPFPERGSSLNWTGCPTQA